MSRDLEEIREIRREKANLEKLIKNYQKRSEELRAREVSLIRKMESLEPGITTWKMSEDKQNSNGYTVSDPILEMFRTIETPPKNVEKLREEVIQKQFENLKLEKVLEARKEEHRKLNEDLNHRKASLGQCVTGECEDLDGPSQERQGGLSGESPKDGSETSVGGMSDELKNNRRERENEPPYKGKHKRIREENTEKEVLDKRKEFFPALSSAMNIMKLFQMSPDRLQSDENRSVKEDKLLDSDRNLLRERLQDKLSELLEEEQALIELYVKAAKAAKEKEEEYKERISELVEQRERDRQLMEIFRDV